METLNVQFSDATDTVIKSYFGSPQDPEIYANLGTVSTDDAMWKTFYDSQPEFSQQYLPAPTTAAS